MTIQRVRRRPMSDINVVPYIDVMLVMLVIFMITAPLLTQGVNVELPKAGAKVIPESGEPLVVTVDAEGQFYINVGEDSGQPVDEDTLVQRSAAVLRYKPQTRVMVRGDTHVDYGRVVIAMALLQQAGAPSVGLITESLESVSGSRSK